MDAQQKLHSDQRANGTPAEAPAQPSDTSLVATTPTQEKPAAPKPAADGDSSDDHSNTKLKEAKKSDEARLERLDELKQVIHKAMTDPTPENLEAAKAAAQELQ